MGVYIFVKIRRNFTQYQQKTKDERYSYLKNPQKDNDKILNIRYKFHICITQR